jgi:hypothetical protein
MKKKISKIFQKSFAFFSVCGILVREDVEFAGISRQAGYTVHFIQDIFGEQCLKMTSRNLLYYNELPPPPQRDLTLTSGLIFQILISSLCGRSLFFPKAALAGVCL